MKLSLLFGLAQIWSILAEPTYTSLEPTFRGDASSCVGKIVKTFYKYRTKLTFIDIEFRQAAIILRELSLLYHVGIISRTTKNLKDYQFDGCIVAAGNIVKFLSEFPNLEREPDWDPKRKFIFIIDNLKAIHLKPIFDVLLKLSINNAIVIDNTPDPIVYAYNPFENYNCGKKYDRVIVMGNCMRPLPDIFFYKFDTNLRNCTFRANSAHWPPFSIDPTITKGPRGVEEFIIKIISEREQFRVVHYNYTNEAEDFSIISKNLSAVGPLTVIQERRDDMMYGGMLLTNSRAAAFDFIWMHLPYVDDIRIVVKAATYVESWRNSYLEFSLAVWLILVSAILAYYAVILLLIRSNDKTMLLFKMCDYFFQHGSNVPATYKIKFLFIFWIWFAYLMSSIYQSSLVGLITNPSKHYQVANEDDIQRLNLRPCISPLMATYFVSVDRNLFREARGKIDGCGSLLKSVGTVSKSDNLYTYTLFAVYSFYKYNFYDEFGRSEIYAFKQPTNKVIYAIYMYKGFPLRQRLQMLSLRLRENGMTDHYLSRLLEDQKENFNFKEPERGSKVIVPWYILIIGSSISTVVFIIELNRKPNTASA